ncbi:MULTISPECIES: hypothetical protein [Vibrio harveyi group]|nr:MULTISPECIES: hypothetical protein [Vibrio harveyi group]AVF60120.1 hypothetical protein AL537_12590 [Vibrio diabolicus]EGR0032464.1 hypothetical protein [Vibrio parahaemolyticus]EGR0200781.1 hypothetical protein [Vibrio parahaemolyticus]EGR1906793.1 hypothetical protein [Vibrio parahaemolyticus]EGR2289653.1 hypothetical protein [Vibrio parahaemolyticus]
MESEQLSIEPDSPSVQAHLGIIQSVIQRMSTNSSSCKAWCVSLVAAILVIVADKGKPDYAWIAILPSIVFAALDTYYLALENSFRNSYNEFVDKVHTKRLTFKDLYSVTPSGNMNKLQIKSLLSFSIWGFYLSLIALIAITKTIALG